MTSKRTSKILGIIALVYSSITLVIILTVITLLILIVTQSEIKYMSGFNFLAYYKQLLVFSLYLITNVLWLISGIALIRYQKWATNLVIITAILSLFQFPFGTAMGIIYLGIMLKKCIKKYCVE